MKTGTLILLLILIVTMAVACSNTQDVVTDAQTNTEDNAASTEVMNTQDTTDTTTNTVAVTIDDALVIDDQSLEEELTADPIEDIGTLDEMPVDDSIPE